MRNQRKMAVLLIVALAAVIATGGLVASNMGFKLNYPLLDATNAGSNSGTQSIGLPYNRQVGIDTASDLFRDIGRTVSGALGGLNACTKVDNVQRYDTAADSPQAYGCGSAPAANFALTAGDGWLVKMDSGKGGDYIVVGSHNPALTINFPVAGGGSNSGTVRYSHPYHGVSATAAEVMTELGGCNIIDNVQRYDSFADSPATYACGSPGANNFPLVPGQAYLVKTKTTGGGTSFVPAHY